MTKLQLFGQEALEMVKNIPKKKSVRHKGTITLKNSVNSEGKNYISVDFLGNNEGSGSPCETEAEAFKQIKQIQEQFGEKYKLEIIDEENIRYNSLLNKWKDFIINLCKERGQEIDKIWFNTSVPYDCEISIRLAGHRCWNSCVNFRFEKGKFVAFDSHFGGGTSFVDTRGVEGGEETSIRNIMEKVFNKECSDSSWEKDDNGHREIVVDEKGWILKN